MNELEIENIELKKQLKDLQYEFDSWKQIHLSKMFDSAYETLCDQQMECIMSLRKKLKEKEMQCVELYKQLKNIELKGIE